MKGPGVSEDCHQMGEEGKEQTQLPENPDDQGTKIQLEAGEAGGEDLQTAGDAEGIHKDALSHHNIGKDHQHPCGNGEKNAQWVPDEVHLF